MSLGLVIANIAGPVRQSAAGPSQLGPSSVGQSSAAAAPAVVTQAASGTANAGTPAGASQGAATAPQLAANFTVLVLQLLNEQGVVTATIPSAQQLAAYRAGTATPPD